jgi:hypothetical protein
LPGLAVVFAEAGGCGDAWREALKEWDVVESKIVKDWQAQAASLGEIKGKRDMLVRLLLQRFKVIPPEVEQAVRGCSEAARLDSRGDAAGSASSVEEFRREAGL